MKTIKTTVVMIMEFEIKQRPVLTIREMRWIEMNQFADN
jgi:hypothetical protein